ncbi:hypothetical protein ABEB36_013063 [Hypothenemus hampei]|uniref:Exosome complex component 10 homolog n=1 Tax=Hypothenemus hampei TaxID=57062 RepID=A0ABD1E8S6_HYPHA
MSKANVSDSNMSSSNTSCQDLITGYKSMAGFTQEGFSCLVEGIKHVNSLPMGRDWSFYTMFESFNEVLKEESHHLMDGMMSVLKMNDVTANMRNQDLDNKTEILVDTNDVILERVSNNIDEMNGLRKLDIMPPGDLQIVTAQLPMDVKDSWERINKATVSISKSIDIVAETNQNNTIRLLAAPSTVRPQIYFKDKIDNSNDNPWEPRIKDKPNSLKPLAIFLEETEFGREFSHPYEYELDRFTPSDEFLKKLEVIRPQLITDTPLIEIYSSEQLPQLVEELNKFKILAIDLEHHSYRSFMGITCLMQISTPEKDYIIDTLSLRNDLWILNEVFTKPSIIKIFHGADSDIRWLQRDLSLYIVNMFDSHLAAKQLEYPRRSLAYLLQKFCNFIPNKQFQLADWRIRPLPEVLKNYAREDTHYLIYIYQNLTNELIDKANGQNNLLKAVFDNSTNLCKQRYFKPLWHEQSHLEFYRRCYRTFDNRQLYALKEIYKWRDQIARIEDDSILYVLPNNMLLEISERLPKEIQGILACCSPIPPLVKANLLEIHKIVLKALEQPIEQPILKEDTRARGSTKKISKINLDSLLHCPHDLTKFQEFKDDLPTLLNSPNLLNSLINVRFHLEQSEPKLSVFNRNTFDKQVLKEKFHKFKENFNFLGPFERYQLVKPFIEAKEKKLAEELAKQNEEAKKAKELKQNTTPNDEERVESICEQFLDLAKQSLPSRPKKVISLLEMGGTKKTKRKIKKKSVAIENICDVNTQTTEVQVHNTQKKGVKRKRPQKGKAAKFQKSENLSNELNKSEAGTSNNNRNLRVDHSGKPVRPKKPKLDRRTRNVEPEDFNAYDYSMVDFRQFQGGAGAVDQWNKQVKFKGRGRGRPNPRDFRNQNYRAISFGRGRGH